MEMENEIENLEKKPGLSWTMCEQYFSTRDILQIWSIHPNIVKYCECLKRMLHKKRHVIS